MRTPPSSIASPASWPTMSPADRPLIFAVPSASCLFTWTGTGWRSCSSASPSMSMPKIEPPM